MYRSTEPDRQFGAARRFKTESQPRGALRGVVAAFILLLFLSAAHAQLEPQCRFPGPWTRVADPVRSITGDHLSPLKIAADPSIIRDGDKYRMWFTNADSRGRTGIALAESSDGIAWNVWRPETGADPVMNLVLTSSATDWDAPGIETADVIRTPDGRYRLYYSGNRAPKGSVTYAIGMAESDDGVHWRRYGTPVLEPIYDWERPLCRVPDDPLSCTQGGVLEPSVIYDAGAKLYRLWYVGLGEKRGSFRTYRVGYATSPDGIRWTRNPEPVLELGQPGSWDAMWTSHVEVIADPRAGFHMFYFGSALGDYRNGVEIQRGALGHAYSPDGLHWERDPANPILRPRSGKIDAWSLGGPTALAEDGKIRLWYFANPTSGIESNIVLAEAPCGP